MSRLSKPFQPYLLESLAKDRFEAASYLQAAAEDSLEMFLVALDDIWRAYNIPNARKD